jgi:hypothetical protein
MSFYIVQGWGTERGDLYVAGQLSEARPQPIRLPERFVHAAASGQDHRDQAVHPLRVGRVMSDSTRSFLLRHQPHAVVAGGCVGCAAHVEIIRSHVAGAGEDDIRTDVGVAAAQIRRPLHGVDPSRKVKKLVRDDSPRVWAPLV